MGGRVSFCRVCDGMCCYIGEGALAIPSNVSRKQKVVEKEEIPGEIGEALHDIKVTAPVALGKISRNVKERLGLKTADTEVILEDKGNTYTYLFIYCSVLVSTISTAQWYQLMVIQIQTARDGLIPDISQYYLLTLRAL